MYKLIIDKPDTFEATVMIEGADNDGAKCRLVLESDNINLMFEGSLSGETCKIPISRLKKYMKDGDRGTLRLEVIADDMFFSPWESEFQAHVSRKVTAEVKEPTIQNEKPKVVVSEVATKNIVDEDIFNGKRDILIKEMASEFFKYKMKLEDVSKRKKTINHVVSKMMERGMITEDMKASDDLIEVVLKSIIVSEKVGQ